MRPKIIKYVLGILTISALTGCMTMKPSKFANETPTFVLEEYFEGKTRAWGIFEDRFGNVRRQFVVDIDGTWDGKLLTLNENFVFNDGEKSFRQWRITKNEDGTYTGLADDVIGSAIGIASGNALNWSYVLDLKTGENSTLHVKFDDWMFLQPGGVLLNRARMSKFGIELGQVTLSFMKVNEMAGLTIPMFWQSADGKKPVEIR
jgi:hypothetical protein